MLSLFTFYLQGDQKLPSREEMWQDINRKSDEMSKRYFQTRRHTIQVDYIPFMDELAEQLGCKPDLRKFLLYVHDDLIHAVVVVVVEVVVVVVVVVKVVVVEVVVVILVVLMVVVMEILVVVVVAAAVVMEIIVVVEVIVVLYVCMYVLY